MTFHHLNIENRKLEKKMKKIDIGFVEECDSWRLESRFFPSKVGGKPAWLDLKNIPTIGDVECKNCKNACIFLCQIYAPYEDDVRAFHRTLYIFVCINDTCCRPNETDNFTVLRCQLPRKNEFYPFEPPDERQDWRPDVGVDKWVRTCQVCGILAPSRCGKCKNVSYCCRSHQLFDWKAGHKQRCNVQPSADTIRASSDYDTILFPEYELAMETDTEMESPDENEENESDEEKSEMAHFKELVETGRAGTLQSERDIDEHLESMSRGEHDQTFANFSERIKKHPDQVLRYDRGGTPLYISSGGRPTNIRKCEECNGDRQFEVQIMPQLLNYLNLKNVMTSIDWGTLLIFTCKNSCVPKAGYVSEYIWKQDIAQPRLITQFDEER